MPGIVQRRAVQFGNADAAACSPSPVAGESALADGVWSKQMQDVGLDRLQKFWRELPPRARQELLRIDKHALLEHARKNLYCSRCNGLLLEGFSQIVMYGKSLQQEGGDAYALANVGGAVKDDSDEAMDPSVHPWGGLMASRDGILTLMDCYLHGKSLWVLQNVFVSARARERERELLYPDACGGGGRGWISHGIANYGRIHGARETCALHTARLSCDTLVDFWSALGDETRLSLFRMKEEDFIERLMYRFDSKRFCRDCRKNVIREFKELKELKRMRRETRCTTWFCAADVAFQYEVLRDKVQVGWHQSFTDSASTYHHFEWAIGSGEGKTDILAFEDVGMTREVQADGLELDGIDACYITLRACRSDGRCTELTVKAHAMKGKPCVHRRLVVGDGFVTITKGQSIRSFFDHAEEAEEEEDDDAIDKDGNELDSDGSRPQKHAKSPELAREFLLDAATVIFKGQVEKAFREGTTRQNAHSLFVCLALKLLEERLHVACKEIITLEKQVKLLEEEEKEKREEERRERRRAKEREKKLRRRERLREKEREREKKGVESDPLSTNGILEELSTSPREETSRVLDEGGLDDEVEEPISAAPASPQTPDDQLSNGFVSSKTQKLISCIINGEFCDRELNGSFIFEQSRSSRRRLRFNHDLFGELAFEWSEKGRSVKDDDNNVQTWGSESNGRCSNGGHRYPRENIVKTSARNSAPRLNEKLLVHGAKGRTRGRCDYNSCSCNPSAGYRGKDCQLPSMIGTGHEIKAIKTTETPARSLHHSNRQSHRICAIDVPAASKERPVSVRSNISRDVFYRKQVWEPTDPWKKSPRNEVEAPLISRTLAIDSFEQNESDVVQNGCENTCYPQPPDDHFLSVDSIKHANSKGCTSESNDTKAEGNPSGCLDAFDLGKKPYYSKVNVDEVDSFSASPTSPLNNGCDSMVGSSSSDNCSSCISEADSSTSSSARNAESSSTSDSEDVSQQFEGRDMSVCGGNDFCTSQDGKNSDREASFSGSATTDLQFDSFIESKIFRGDPVHDICKLNISQVGYEVAPWRQQMLPTYNHSMHPSYVPFPTTGYHNQHPTSWNAAANNGMISFPRLHHYPFPSPLGYSIPTCQPPDLYVHYCGQPLTNPMFAENQIPIFQNVSKMNTHNSIEQVSNFRMVRSRGNCMGDGPNFLPTPERSPPEKQTHPELSSTSENQNIGIYGKSHEEISSFSLFHFNGPVAVVSGSGLDSVPTRNETMLEAESNQNCPKKETVVEEYSLFASTSGYRFSFF